MKRILFTFFICLVSPCLFAMQLERMQQEKLSDADYTIVAVKELKKHLDTICMNCGLVEEQPQNRTALLENVRNGCWAAHDVMFGWRKGLVYRHFHAKFLNPIAVLCSEGTALLSVSQTLDQSYGVNKMKHDQFQVSLMELLANTKKIQSDTCNILVDLAEFFGLIQKYVSRA